MGCAGLPGEAIGPGGQYQNLKEKLQKVFHVYWNKFEMLYLIYFLLYLVKINRGYLLFLDEYQIYFIECSEKKSVFFTSA